MRKILMDTPNAQLPAWPFDGFTTDSSLDRVTRVAAVEHALAQKYGGHHVPDKEGRERYFADALDALIQRRWIARHIVDLQDWRENFQRIVAKQHGAVLPTMREVAEMQKAEFQRTGRVETTGFEGLDVYAERGKVA
jgi:hypothetical protein